MYDGLLTRSTGVVFLKRVGRVADAGVVAIRPTQTIAGAGPVEAVELARNVHEVVQRLTDGGDGFVANAGDEEITSPLQPTR